jgi:hypothetical protein
MERSTFRIKNEKLKIKNEGKYCLRNTLLDGHV